MIRTEQLSKYFQTRKGQPLIRAVQDLTLEVSEGEVFGFLGPNGAGKTTTVRMLTSLIAPTAGRAFIGRYEVGKDDRKIRGTVGILTESPGMYERLTAEKNLSIYANLYDVPDVPGQVEKYLRMLGLWNRRYDEVGSFSKGMRQKLAIARALLHEPQALFLDEPTTGLDPQARQTSARLHRGLRQGPHHNPVHPQPRRGRRLCDPHRIFKSRLITVERRKTCAPNSTGGKRSST